LQKRLMKNMDSRLMLRILVKLPLFRGKILTTLISII
jgi:hypothetical protein